jgi:AraC-like DNA-binding protein
MKLLDTTDPISQRGVRTLFTEVEARKKLNVVTRFRMHLIGLYYAQVGPEWSSSGQEQSDYLHHIDFVCSGRRQVVHAGKVIDLAPGWAWYLPGCTPVERRCDEKCRLYFLKFRCEWLPGVDPLLDWTERKPLRLGRWKETDFLKYLGKGTEPETQSLFRLHAQIYTWLANALPNLESIIEQHIKTHGRFEPVFDLIENQLGANLRVEELAAVMKLPVHTFSMAFRRSVGFSPKAHLKRRLNQEAIKLLLQSDASVKEIAAQLNFADEYYFSRFFKKLNSIPPATYRQKFVSMQPK